MLNPRTILNIRTRVWRFKEGLVNKSPRQNWSGWELTWGHSESFDKVNCVQVICLCTWRTVVALGETFTMLNTTLVLTYSVNEVNTNSERTPIFQTIFYLCFLSSDIMVNENAYSNGTSSNLTWFSNTIGLNIFYNITSSLLKPMLLYII